MIGQRVELMRQWYKLPAGAEGVVWGRNQVGWEAVFCGVSVTLPFNHQDVFYRFV